jgi:hypothetical protein
MTNQFGAVVVALHDPPAELLELHPFAKLARSKSRIVYFGANNAERYAIAEGNGTLARKLRDDVVAPAASSTAP